jgi:hypothetical protein
MRFRYMLVLLALGACDPITTVQGRVVRAPGADGVSGATVNLTCDGLKPDEGMTATTDAKGSFAMATVGGALPDACTLRVTEAASPPVTTTIGAAKAKDDDPGNRVRNVEVALPAK